MQAFSLYYVQAPSRTSITDTGKAKDPEPSG